MPILTAALKGEIKTLAGKCGLLKTINSLEYWYANRISSEALKFYRPFISPDSLVFDIGAHRGLKTSLFLKLGAKVVAVEPMPECAEHLRHIKVSADRLTIFEGGCSDVMGTSELHLCEIHPQNSTLSAEFRERVEGVHSNGWKTVTIQTTTLDNLICQHGLPAFCKIDTEGFEERVLAGLGQKIPYLSFEYSLTRREIFKACLQRLNDIGFHEFNCLTGRVPALQMSKWVSATELFQHVEAAPERLSEGDVIAR